MDAVARPSRKNPAMGLGKGEVSPEASLFLRSCRISLESGRFMFFLISLLYAAWSRNIHQRGVLVALASDSHQKTDEFSKFSSDAFQKRALAGIKLVIAQLLFKDRGG